MITTTVPPSEVPVSAEYAKKHIKALNDLEDDLIDVWLAAALRATEKYLERRLVTQTVEITLDDWFVDAKNIVKLPLGGIQEITKIETLDQSGAYVEWSSDLYQWSPGSPGRFAALDSTYPTLYRAFDNIKVTAVVGYGAAADVPATLKHAMAMMVSLWDISREPIAYATPQEIPYTCHDLLTSEKWRWYS